MNTTSSKLLILQVSDFHLRKEGNVACERIADIAKAVANTEVDLRAAIIAFSGDVAYSGKQAEYEVANRCSNNLKSELEARLRNVPVFVVGVPGNHDCDFEEETSAHRILIDSLAKDPSRDIGADVLSQCTAVQSNFFNFLDGVQRPARVRSVGDAYFEFEIPVGESFVLFRCYNTAMGSVLHEKPGSLAVPHALLNGQSSQQAADYVVSIFHHPYNWLSQFNVRTFRKHIDATSDLILTGHEHDADNYSKYTRRGESVMYLEGPAFQEDGSADYSGFNAIWVDLVAQQQKVITFGWNESLFEPTTASQWQPFRRSSKDSPAQSVAVC